MPSTACSDATRSGIWSFASQCPHQLRMSGTEGACRAFSILLTFEQCQPANSARCRRVNPASVRISLSRTPRACLASCAADDAERNTAAMSGRPEVFVIDGALPDGVECRAAALCECDVVPALLTQPVAD